MKTQLWKKKFKARTRLSGLDIKSIVIVARACLGKVNPLLGFNSLVLNVLSKLIFWKHVEEIQMFKSPEVNSHPKLKKWIYIDPFIPQSHLEIM